MCSSVVFAFAGRNDQSADAPTRRLCRRGRNHRPCSFQLLAQDARGEVGIRASRPSAFWRCLGPLLPPGAPPLSSWLILSFNFSGNKTSRGEKCSTSSNNLFQRSPPQIAKREAPRSRYQEARELLVSIRYCEQKLFSPGESTFVSVTVPGVITRVTRFTSFMPLRRFHLVAGATLYLRNSRAIWPSAAW